MDKIIYKARIDFEDYGGFVIDGTKYYSVINKFIADKSYQPSGIERDGWCMEAEFESYEDAANWSIAELESHLKRETDKINKSIDTLKGRIEKYLTN
jgi:hypothetical protein